MRTALEIFEAEHGEIFVGRGVSSMRGDGYVTSVGAYGLDISYYAGASEYYDYEYLNETPDVWFHTGRNL